MAVDINIRAVVQNKQQAHQLIEEILKAFPDLQMAAQIDPQPEPSEKVDIAAKKAQLAPK